MTNQRHSQRHSQKVITYENVYTHHRANLCLACSEIPDVVGYSQVRYGLHRGMCDRDPVEAARVEEYRLECEQIERDRLADDPG
jgi:hypothetical protein